MSYDSAKQYSPKNVFSGGYADNTPDHSLAERYSPDSKNTRQDGMATVSRLGYEELATFTGTGTSFLGIGSFTVNQGTVTETDRLLVRYNEDATHQLATIDEAGNFANTVTGALISSANRMHFTTVGTVVYCMNGVDAFGKLANISAYTAPVTGIADFSPSFSVLFNGSHWASGWSDMPFTVYKSVGGDYEDFTIATAGTDQLSFKETIVGLASTGQAMFYFGRNTISVTDKGDVTNIDGAISYNTSALTAHEGAINHSSIVVAGNQIYYWTPSNKISKIARGQSNEGFDVYELSERDNKGITKKLATLDRDQTESVGYYLQEQNIIKWFVKSSGASNNDTVIIYDITTDTFHIDETVEFFGGVVAFMGKNYTISANGKKVYRDEYGLDDDGSAIDFEYNTKELDAGLYNIKKELWEESALVAINSVTPLIQRIYIDGVLVNTKQVDSDNLPDSPVVGTMYPVTIRRTKGSLQKKGYKIRIRYTCATVGARVRLEGLDMLIETLSKKANNLTD